MVITTKLYGYSNGSCQLSISNGTRNIVRQAEVMYQSQYSTCAGFSVPISELGDGTWKIKLDVISGGVTLSKELSYGT